LDNLRLSLLVFGDSILKIYGFFNFEDSVEVLRIVMGLFRF